MNADVHMTKNANLASLHPILLREKVGSVRLNA